MNKYDEAFKKMCELDYEDLEELLKDGITQFKIKAYGEGYEQGKFDAEMDSNEGNYGEDVTQNFELSTEIGDRLKELSQERRDEIIEQAKKDVEELKDDYDGSYTVDNGGHRLHQYACTAEYIVNKDKRTVVVLMRGRSTGRVRARGIAKAHPNDCFNVHIGKAIALRRALGLEVPDEYLNAPQPTEVLVGDVVYLKTSNLRIPYTRTISKVSNDYITYTNDGEDSIKHVYKNGRIIDDSREGRTDK